MSTLLIGRDNAAAQISIANSYKNVSRRHAELSAIDGGTYRLVDLNSSNGIEILERNRWQRVSKAVVTLDHRVRLGGDYEASVRDLLAMAKQGARQAGTQVAGGNAHAAVGFTPVAVKLPQHRAERTSRDADGGKCARCGQAYAGNFCPNCGYSSQPGAIAFLVGEFGGQARLGHFQTFQRLLHAPIESTLNLTKDPAYTGHMAFFATCTAFAVAVQSYAWSVNPPDVPEVKAALDSYGSMALTIFQYAAIFVSFLIGYWLFKRASPAPPPAREYLKLLCLMYGVTALLGSAPNLMLISFFGLKHMGLPPGSQVFLGFSMFAGAAIFTLFSLYYSAKVQKEFWSISWPRMVGLIVMQILITIALFSFIAAIVFLIIEPMYAQHPPPQYPLE